MLFNSFVFLYLFLPITYFVFWRLRTRNARYVWLAITGYVFYAFWNPKFCLLMALSTFVSYAAGLGFLRWHDRAPPPSVPRRADRDRSIAARRSSST